jgi:hypothetical protein
MLLSADISIRIAALPLPKYISVGSQSTQKADSLALAGRCTGGQSVTHTIVYVIYCLRIYFTSYETTPGTYGS